MDKRAFDLPCYDRKSFYGKAKVIEAEDGRYLLSYDTLVCFVSYDGKFKRLWHGYSATTMRHVNAFMKFLGLRCGGKAWWDKMLIGEEYTLYEAEKIYDSLYK